MIMKSKLNAEDQMIVNSEFDKKAKQKNIMYLLWWFTGGLGGHRYYMGDIGYAIGMTLTLGGLGFWSLIDVFLIGKRLETKNDAVEAEIIQNVITMRGTRYTEDN